MKVILLLMIQYWLHICFVSFALFCVCFCEPNGLAHRREWSKRPVQPVLGTITERKTRCAI
jgi:hypothetical protein